MNDSASFCLEIALQHLPELIGCGYRKPPQAQKIDKYTLPHHSMYAVRMGEIRISEWLDGDEQRRVVRPGEVIVIPAGMEHATTAPIPVGTQYFWMQFKLFSTVRSLSHGEARKAVLNNFKSELPPFEQKSFFLPRHLDVANGLDDLIQIHLEMMERLKLWGKDDYGTRIRCADLIYQLHHALSSGLKREMGAGTAASVTPDAHHVAMARRNIHTNFQKEISRHTVAKTLGLNPSYLGRCFRKQTGVTVVAYIQRIRIENAKSFLVTQQYLPIRKVARLSGFKSTAYFCKIFKKLEKMSPGVYAGKFRSGRLLNNSPRRGPSRA
jgi:AraC-like DNA-binding protein